MKSNFAIWIFALLAMAGCRKDPAFETTDFTLDNLEKTLASWQPQYVSNRAIVMAGNHTSFERETNREPLHIYIAQTKLSEIAYFTTDSLAHRDSLVLYKRRPLISSASSEGFFTRISRSEPVRDHFARITYRSEDSLFISPPITIRATTLKTNNVSDMAVFTNSSGYLEFSWARVAGAAEYLMTLTGPTGDVFCAIYTARTNFLFYDLRFVIKNLTPELKNPMLISGENYVMTVVALNRNHWMMAYGTHHFVVE